MRVSDDRHAGMLLHISSLPGPFGIGDLGTEAFEMAELLQASGFDHWQILPIGPTGYGNSPYASRSTFAGNELFIDMRTLVSWNLLDVQSIISHPEFPSDHVDYEAVIAWKIPLLKQAAATFLHSIDSQPLADSYETFCEHESYWLSDYALFMSLYEQFHDARWFSHWPKPYAERDEHALAAYIASHQFTIELWKVLQFFFQLQWRRFRSHVNDIGIKLIGDLPIFVAADSVDTWSNLHLFKTDDGGHFSAVSGVPPDFFSETGQLWGNPVYDWEVCANSSYDWWIHRLNRTLQSVDIIRIDHFRGFDAYWEIPAGSPTAETGFWVEAPGSDFFRVVRQRLGEIPLIAEDLGVMTPSVEQLRDSNGFPGMKIFQFGFVLDDQGKLDTHEEFLPHNYPRSCVAYTGTHDNDTTRGWFTSISSRLRQQVCEYLDCKPEEVVERMIRALCASHAQTIIIPCQDIFDLDGRSRMNTPSTCGPANWSWRVERALVERFPAKTLRQLFRLYGRYPLLPHHTSSI